MSRPDIAKKIADGESLSAFELRYAQDRGLLPTSATIAVDDESQETIDLDALTKPKLIELAAERGVEVGSSWHKKEIVAALVAAEAATQE